MCGYKTEQDVTVEFGAQSLFKISCEISPLGKNDTLISGLQRRNV